LPTVTDADGETRSMIDMVRQYWNDPESGVQAAMTLFLTSEWRPAA
jgi:hypothetical protein